MELRQRASYYTNVIVKRSVAGFIRSTVQSATRKAEAIEACWSVKIAYINVPDSSKSNEIVLGIPVLHVQDPC
jgi:hypothetical protein